MKNTPTHRKIARAIVDRENISISNTQTFYDAETRIMRVTLHGHLIAVIQWSADDVRTLQLSDAGYSTRTTTDRLHLIASEIMSGVRVNLRKGNTYFTDREGNETKLSDQLQTVI